MLDVARTDSAAAEAAVAAGAAGPVRGACPGGHRPFEAADGLLVRVRVPGGLLTCDQVEAVATAAATGGNGTVELTSRANLQVRGVRDGTLDAVRDGLVAAGLLPADAAADERRNVMATPAAGLDPTEVADVRPVVRELAGRLGSASGPAGLHPKAGVVVDGGGAVSVRGIRQDVGLGAARRRDTGEVVAEVALGRPLPRGADPDPAAPVLVLPLSAAATVAIHALALTATPVPPGGPRPSEDARPAPPHPAGPTGPAVHAGPADTTPTAPAHRNGTPPPADTTPTAPAHRNGTPPPADTTPAAPGHSDGAARPDERGQRLHEVVAEWGLDAVVAEVGRRSGVPVVPVAAGLLDRAAPKAAAPLGVRPARAAATALVGAAPVLGRLDAQTLAALAAAARRHGDGTVRLTPWRTVLVPARAAEAAALAAELGALGLATGGDDPAVGVVACVGRAGCEAGHTDTLADARRLIDTRRATRAGGADVHVSGCGKRCASREVHDVTLVGVAPGRYDVFVRDPGTGGERLARRDVPFAEAVPPP